MSTVQSETDDHLYEFGLREYIQEYSENFNLLVTKLSPFDRQILLEYYTLGKTEQQLATIHSLSQPTIFRALQRATKSLALLIQGKKTVTESVVNSKPLRLRESSIIGKFIIDLTAIQQDLQRSRDGRLRRDGRLFASHSIPL